MDDLRRNLREFTLNTQQKLEKERAELLNRCTTAETKLKKMDAYVRTNLVTYQKEIVRLKGIIASSEAPVRGPKSTTQ